MTQGRRRELTDIHNSLDHQVKVLVKMHNLLLKTRDVGKNAVAVPERHHTKNRSLTSLYNYLHEDSNNKVKYLMTHRLNQDDLKRQFGYLRSKGGGLNDHPSSLI